MCESLRIALNDVLNSKTELPSISDSFLDSLLDGPEDDPDITDTGPCEVTQCIEENRLVRDGEHVLVPRESERSKASTVTTRQHETFHRFHVGLNGRLAPKEQCGYLGGYLDCTSVGPPVKVVVTGGGGYVGTSLVPLLLSRGHEVTVLDRFFFGDGFFSTLPHSGSLRLVRDDVRWVEGKLFLGQDAVIDMAALSNDPAGELDPWKTYDINYLG